MVINNQLQEAMGAQSSSQPNKYEYIGDKEIIFAAIFQKFNNSSNWDEKSDTVSMDNQSILLAPPKQLAKFISDNKRSMSVPVFCARNLYILPKEGKLQFIDKQGNLQAANYNNEQEMVEFILRRSPMEKNFNQHLNKIAKQLVEEIETIQISKEKLSDADVDWADCEKII